MPKDWESHLQRWVSAGVVDPALAGRIRRWESSHGATRGPRWLMPAAFIVGALALVRVSLSFGSAHWDHLDAGRRMMAAMVLIAALHLAGALVASTLRNLSIALHALGTLVLGAGILLIGQTFQLNGDWPKAFLLWGTGAALAWLLLRHWTQGLLAAILIPVWLAGEWWVRIVASRAHDLTPVMAGLCALSLAYLGARRSANDVPDRKALGWLGCILLLPLVFSVPAAWDPLSPTHEIQVAAWSIAGLLPLAFAVLLRGRGAALSCLAIVWALLAAYLGGGGSGNHLYWYGWCVVGSIGLALWGSVELRMERVNLGIAAFVLALAFFVASKEMARFGRSKGMVLVLVVLVGGGWFLARTRRQVIAKSREGAE
jgi:uncharacterized membrane protein